MTRPIATVGLKWDKYTPAVEGQITRDLIALQASGAKAHELLVVCPDDSANRLLAALGIKQGVAQALATLWITYRTEEEFVEAPEHATQVIERDLYVERVGGKIDPREHPGYYMKPQGRVIAPSLINRMMPTHNGATDPMVILLWSATKGQ